MRPELGSYSSGMFSSCAWITECGGSLCLSPAALNLKQEFIGESQLFDSVTTSRVVGWNSYLVLIVRTYGVVTPKQGFPSSTSAQRLQVHIFLIIYHYHCHHHCHHRCCCFLSLITLKNLTLIQQFSRASKYSLFSAYSQWNAKVLNTSCHGLYNLFVLGVCYNFVKFVLLSIFLCSNTLIRSLPLSFGFVILSLGSSVPDIHIIYSIIFLHICNANLVLPAGCDFLRSNQNDLMYLIVYCLLTPGEI